jgi:hypothetical protein
LLRVWDEGRRPAWIRIRPIFIRQPEPAAPGEISGPAAARLLRSRGVALRFYLLALFEAQCRPRPGTGQATRMRLHHGDGAVTWADLVAVDAEGVRRTKERRTALDNRVRQVKGALATLYEEGMVDMPLRDGVHEYAEFLLMHESASFAPSSPAQRRATSTVMYCNPRQGAGTGCRSRANRAAPILPSTAPDPNPRGRTTVHSDRHNSYRVKKPGEPASTLHNGPATILIHTLTPRAA